MSSGDSPKYDSEFGSMLGSISNLNELVERLRAGDNDASQQIYDRYVRRLIGLVRSRLPDKYRKRFDSQDVVQAAMASFFGRMKNGEFAFEHNGQLWHLLAAIAMNKLREKQRFNDAQIRDVNREIAPAAGLSGSVNGIPVEELISEPSDAEERELREEVERVLEDYKPKQRHVIALCLQGYSVKEIAREAVTTAANVRQILRDFKEDLAVRLNSSFAT